MLGKHCAAELQPNPRQSNLERQSQRAWRKEVEAGDVSAALVKDSVKPNR